MGTEFFGYVLKKIKKYLQQMEDYDRLTNGLYERGLLL